jgi:ring-1,2-phenylacetyl-CoA epoxidase subunit PaaC
MTSHTPLHPQSFDCKARGSSAECRAGGRVASSAMLAATYDGESASAAHRAATFCYLLRLGDTALINAQRLVEWCGRGPMLEEEVALANLALDNLGQARLLLTVAGSIEDAGRDEDALAFLREPWDFFNVLVVELPNGDFAETVVRQFLFSTWMVELLQELRMSRLHRLAAISEKALKELKYHRRHFAEWLVRLGDGTGESHARAQTALERLWMYTGELFEMDDVDHAMVTSGIGADLNAIKPRWDRVVDEVLERATLARPSDAWMQSGGRRGEHTEHLTSLLAEMQYLQRCNPGAKW